MITVNGPNGVTINFPDGTDAATIESVMTQALGGSAAPAQPKAEEPKKPEDVPGSSLDVPATTLGGLIEGIPIAGPIIRGGVERAAAATLAPFSDLTYGEILGKIQEDKARMKEEHPVLDAGSQIAGAVGSTLPLAATATGAKALGIVGGSLGKRSAAGLASGAAIGGADALVRSGGDVGEAAKGGAIGGAIGMGVPIVGAGIGAGMRAVKAAASPATQAIVNRIRPQGQAADLTMKALERDGLGLDDVGVRLSAMQKTHPDAVLADVGGANTRGLARAAANTPGPQKEAIHSFMEARNLAQPQRITEAVSEILQNPDDFAKTATRLAAERERIAGPIYQEAFRKGAPVNVSGVVKHIDDKVMPGVSGLADPMADLRPDGLTATLSKLRGFFATEKNQRFDLRQLHQIKMELDDMIGGAKRAGEDGKARALLGVQTRLLQAMDKASPLYKKARGIYSNTFELEDAMDVGRNIFRSSPAEIKAAVQGMTDAQRELVEVGAARAIADAVAGMRDGRDAVKALFGTPKVRDALRSVFRDAQSYRKLQVTLLRETRMRKASDAVRGNSTTAAQLSDLMDIQGGGSFGRDVFSLLMDGRPGQAAAAAVRQVLKGETGLNEKVAGQLSDMLLSTDPAKVKTAIQTLSKRRDALERLHRRLTNTGNYGAAVGGQALQVPYRSSISD